MLVRIWPPGKTLGFKWQVSGAAPRQAQPQHLQRSARVAAQTYSCSGYCPADSKGPLQAESLMGLSPVCTVSVYLLGGPHSAAEDGGAKGEACKKLPLLR